MQSAAYLSLSLYLLTMLGIGYYAYKKTNNDVSGFMLGGRQLSPAVTALSAGASDMSGWMLMGLPGALYLSGLSSAWIAIGLVIGAYLNYCLVAPRLRVYTEIASDSVTIPEYFERRFEDQQHLLRIICSVVIIIFFAIYTTSGVVAGGKLFETSFGLNYQTGLLITAGVVVAYSTFGGFLAVSTTDFVQGCIMFIALILVPLVTLTEVGGVSNTITTIKNIDPGLLSLGGGTTLGVISAMAWGLGYFGQPHIIVRFMAIRSVDEVKTARRIGMSWMIVTLLGACAVGLCGLAYITANDLTLEDPETIFIVLSTTLFHPLIAGFLLAAILAAIMSTISSQLLVTSSSLTEDIYHTLLNKQASEKQLVLIGRLSIVAVALLAILLAQNRDNSILSLVSNAWAGFGAAFGPVILFSLFWKEMTRAGALAGILTGAITVLVWVYGPFQVNGNSLGHYLYEIIPGVVFASLAIYFMSKFSNPASENMRSQFNQMLEKVKHT